MFPDFYHGLLGAVAECADAIACAEYLRATARNHVPVWGPRRSNPQLTALMRCQ